MFRSHLALLAVSGLFTLGVISPLAAQVGCDDWPTPAFFKAATAATVQDCLGAGADPNARDVFGLTPLHRAAEISQTPEIITALVNAGADPNARDRGRPHTAAFGGGTAARHRRSSRPSSTPARTPTRATEERQNTAALGGVIQRDTGDRHGPRHGPCQRRRGPQRARRARPHAAALGGGTEQDTGGRHGTHQRRRGPQRAH